MLIHDKIKSGGYNLKAVSRILDIEYRKIYRWQAHDHVDNHMEFLKFILFLKLDPAEVLADYHDSKNKKEKL